MIDREDLTCWIHHSMAITGGYLGVYALLCRDDFFGNALTSNMIYIVTSLFGQNLMDVLIRIAAVLLYVAGCASTIVLSKKYHKKLYPYSLAVTGLAIIILGFLPERMNAVVGLYPIFFAMAFQWNSFPGAYGYNASCIFSTNNCRQIANALTEYSITHEKKLLKKACFFFRHGSLFPSGRCVFLADSLFYRHSQRLAVCHPACCLRGSDLLGGTAG